MAEMTDLLPSLESSLYRDDVACGAEAALPWERLSGAVIAVTGATGLIGTHLIDVVMHRNRVHGQQCTVVAFGRDEEKARRRFRGYWDSPLFRFVRHDIGVPLQDGEAPRADYILHLASNTHPRAYATDPIGTITANIDGTRAMLEYACASNASRMLFASSCEIYGENRGDVDRFPEDYCGYIDPNTLRAGYPESKRCGETLCQAYRTQRGARTVVARLARCYGPTVLPTDSKASSQFLRNGLRGENIVLKSDGMQWYSYLYVTDAVTGLLTALLLGEDGMAYNVADPASDIHLKDLAALVAGVCRTRVVFDLPDDTERAGFSRATKAVLDASRLRSLGWHARYGMSKGIRHTLSILAGLS